MTTARRILHPHVRALASAALVAAFALPLARSRPPVTGSVAQEPDPPATALAREMEVVEDGLRKLRRTVRDPEQDAASLAALTEVQVAVVRGKAELPAMTERVPEAERAAFVAAYRKEMLVLLEGFVALEKAILDGDHDAARELYKELAAMEDPGHERFTDDE